ncbi:DUF3592 domain-containing protein [Hymenobacter radiodurans]|uniref:DUF3592 domain-containing protein n=1 Tax=Hymenobacter radiodurans TaxID=2496028 RepID=UPI001058AD7F
MLLLSKTDPASLATINYALILLGGAFLYVARYLYQKRANLKKTGIETSGIVYRFQKQDDDNESVTYAPVFRFVTFSEEVVFVQHWLGSGRPSLRVGQEVRILYNPLNPQEYVLNYRLVDWKALLCALVGIVLIVGTLSAHFLG